MTRQIGFVCVCWTPHSLCVCHQQVHSSQERAFQIRTCYNHIRAYTHMDDTASRSTVSRSPAQALRWTALAAVQGFLTVACVTAVRYMVGLVSMQCTHNYSGLLTSVLFSDHSQALLQLKYSPRLRHFWQTVVGGALDKPRADV